jgi:4-hydroxybenzoyl-CoA thioesterase
MIFAISKTAEWEREVRDHECDAAGIVYYANYSVYLHDARLAFMANAGVNSRVLELHGLSLTVAEQSIRYIKPLRRQERFVVQTSIVGFEPMLVRTSHRIVERSEERLCAESLAVLQLALNHGFDFHLSASLIEVVRNSGLDAVLSAKEL